jgi:hypothetical protein
MRSTSTQIGNLQIEKVWKLTRGSGVRVALLDTGVRTSAALPQARVESVASDGGAPSATADPHGTFSGALIASEKRDAEGVAPEAKLLSIQITTAADTISAGEVVRGLELALQLGCDVISCSFVLRKLGSKADAIADVVRRAHLRGIPVLAAHGNEAGEPAPFPESVQHAIVVSAHRANGRPLPVNFNQWTDVFCLGEKLTVVNGSGLTRTWPGKTSGATALTAGVVALALAAVPKNQRVSVGMAVEGLLKATAANEAPQADGSPVLRIQPKAFVDAALAL